MKIERRYTPEVCDRANRMVLEQPDQHESQWAAMVSIAAKMGCTTETLRRSLRRSERDHGIREVRNTAGHERIREPEREVRELRQVYETLREAPAFFAQVQLDRPPRKGSPSSMPIGLPTGSSRSAGCCRSPRRPTLQPSSGCKTPSACA